MNSLQWACPALHIQEELACGWYMALILVKAGRLLWEGELLELPETDVWIQLYCKVILFQILFICWLLLFWTFWIRFRGLACKIAFSWWRKDEWMGPFRICQYNDPKGSRVKIFWIPWSWLWWLFPYPIVLLPVHPLIYYLPLHPHTYLSLLCVT